MQRLGPFARQDLDRGQTADLICGAVGQENFVCDGDNHVVIDERGGARRHSEDIADA